MSNELTDVRCPCGAEFQADSYDAGFIAGSGMCQNCDAALPPKDICTCPSGDGSLRWPCPKHPAVEQAGGDERAAFEAWLAQAMSKKFEPEFDLAKYEDSGEYRYSPAAAYWKAWQARAALAQPSPVSEALIYACKNLAQITSSDGSGHADIAMAVLRMAGVGDDERERLVNEWKAARAWKPSPAQAEGAPVVGCLCGMPMTEGHHSQDGCCNLEEFAPQAQAEQAEDERPEVVGQLVTWPTGQRYVGRVRERKVCKTEDVMTVAQHAASVARWAEMFNRVEQERDAALARVAEMEACGAPALLAAADYFAERAKGPSPGWVTLSAVAKELRVRADKATAAKAQHSLPEGWMLVPVEPLLNMMSDKDHDTRITAERQLLSMLAAAPGKEGV